jgi:hypothetical protein
MTGGSSPPHAAIDISARPNVRAHHLFMPDLGSRATIEDRSRGAAPSSQKGQGPPLHDLTGCQTPISSIAVLPVDA